MNKNNFIKSAINTLKKENILDENIINFLDKNKIITFSNIHFEKDSSELFKFAFFNNSIKEGRIDIYILENFYNSFKKTISIYAKENEINFVNKMLKLLKELENIQDEFRRLLYPYVFSFEFYLERFLYKEIIVSRINFSDILRIVIKEENDDLNNKLDLIYISKRLHSFSFYHKIEILKFLWKEKYIDLEKLSNYNFIHKNKLNQLRKIIYKKYKDLNKKEELIFMWNVIPILNNTRKYRNNISHLNDLVMKKEKIDYLYNYLIKQEDFLRNDVARKLIINIKNFLENSSFIKKNSYLKKYFEKFLFYNES